VGGAETSTAGIKVTGLGSGDFVEGLEARGYLDGQIDSGQSEDNCGPSENIQELWLWNIPH
jgi:hypothetical protein